jgi:DNA-binding response OmpR family regulator
MTHILLIEPDSLLAGSLTDYFANANHTVSVHNDLQAAITDADRRRPDIVITELQLAGRSGVEFLYEFRSYPDWQNIPIIIFTNLHPEQIQIYREAMSELSVRACLRKSAAGLADLQAEVERALTPAYEEV